MPEHRTATWVKFAAFFLGFFLTIPVVLRSQPLNDPGALWHVRVGDLILEGTAFPRTDPFTWSHAGQHWVPQQWGAELLMALLHRLGGFDALLMAMSTALALTAAALAMRFLDAGLHWLPTAAILAFGISVAGFHFYLRPHIASIALFALVMFRLVDFDRRRCGVVGLAWLIPLCAVWTNLHGGVLGGIATVAIAGAGWALFRVVSLKQAGWLALIVAGCLLATLLNPFGLDMHRTWFSIVGSSVLKEAISEHQPLSMSRSDGQAVAGFACFYLLMLAGTLPRRPHVTWLLPGVWFGLSLSSIRHGPLFCVAALAVLPDLLPETVWFRLLKKHGNTLVRAPAAVPSTIGWRGWSVPLAAVVLSLTLERARISVPVIGHGWARFDPKMVPVDLVEPLQEYAKSKPVGFPIFNDANLGGFLIYYTPTLKIFMDDRCELYGDAGMSDYVDMANVHPERIEEWAAKAPFDMALVQRDRENEPAQMDRYLRNSSRWVEVAHSERAVLYRRVDGPYHSRSTP